MKLTENGFTKVCHINDLSESTGKRFIINNTEIALFKVKDEIFALNNICPHQHTALIYDGFIEDGCVVCPAHGWKFNLKTGKKPSGSSGLDSYEVKIEQGVVFVKVNPKEFRW